MQPLPTSGAASPAQAGTPRAAAAAGAPRAAGQHAELQAPSSPFSSGSEEEGEEEQEEEPHTQQEEEEFTRGRSGSVVSLLVLF